MDFRILAVGSLRYWVAFLKDAPTPAVGVPRRGVACLKEFPTLALGIYWGGATFFEGCAHACSRVPHTFGPRGADSSADQLPEIMSVLA